MGQPLNIWDKIQQGVSETERLIAQKDYNKAMIQSRQTLEVMVKALGNKACIVESDLATTIDQLYDGRWIDKSTREHYHKIRIIGNKAAHEDNNSAADATLALTLLSQEVYAFSDYKTEYRNTRTIYVPTDSGRIPAVPAPVLPLVLVPATAQLPETLPQDVPLETDGLQTAGNGKAALRSATYSHCWLFYWELSY